MACFPLKRNVHLQGGKLLVAHDQPKSDSPTIDMLYLKPLDSLLSGNKGHVYSSSDRPFY